MQCNVNMASKSSVKCAGGSGQLKILGKKSVGGSQNILILERMCVIAALKLHTNILKKVNHAKFLAFPLSSE